MHRSLKNLIKAFGLLAVLLLVPLVQAVPTITSQSHSGIVNVNYGSALTLSVVASGNGLTYQWYSSGTPIPGATSASYAITFVDETTTANYRVRVTDATGFVESSFIVPSVQNIPNIAFVTQPAPTGQTVAAGGSVTYTFTMSGPMTGNNPSVLTSPGGAATSGFGISIARGSNGIHTGTITASSVTTGMAGNYMARVAMTNHGTITSSPFTLAVDSSGLVPVITVHPTGRTVEVGNSTTFNVTATGSGLSYQWKKDGVNISGATSNFYSINPVNGTRIGSYAVMVSNSSGTVTSNAATLSIAVPTIQTQPVSKTVSLGAATNFFVATTNDGSHLSYQWHKDGAAIPGATTASYSFMTNADSPGTYTVTITNAGGSVTSNPATLAVTQAFSAWTLSHALPFNQNGQTDDPDRDGSSNLLEYALGLNPASPSASVLPAAVTESGQVVVRFTRARAATGVTLQTFTSPDLVTWTPGPAPTVESISASTETCIVTLPASQQRHFLRLEATSP